MRENDFLMLTFLSIHRQNVINGNLVSMLDYYLFGIQNSIECQIIFYSDNNEATKREIETVIKSRYKNTEGIKSIKYLNTLDLLSYKNLVIIDEDYTKLNINQPAKIIATQYSIDGNTFPFKGKFLSELTPPFNYIKKIWADNLINNNDNNNVFISIGTKRSLSFREAFLLCQKPEFNQFDKIYVIGSYEKRKLGKIEFIGPYSEKPVFPLFNTYYYWHPSSFNDSTFRLPIECCLLGKNVIWGEGINKNHLRYKDIINGNLDKYKLNLNDEVYSCLSNE